jgi:O-antigen ligase
MIAGAIDISGDYLDIFGFSTRAELLDKNYFQSLSLVLIIILAIVGMVNIVRQKYAYKPGIGAKLFLILFMASVIVGATTGLVNGNPISYIVGDSRNVIIYAALFAIDDIKYSGFENKLYALYFAVCSIVLIKLLIAVISFVAVTTTSPFSVRFLLRLTPYLIGFALINAALMANKFNRKNFIMFINVTVAVVMSQTRGIQLGYACGFMVLCMVLIFMKRGVRLLVPGLIILATVLILALGIWFNPDAVQGKWSGDMFDQTVNIRLEQIDSMMNLFKSHPFFGIGLGGYDPDYERFVEETSRPYLQELEYHNLLSKLGIIGIYLWICSFLALFYECWRRIRKTTSMKSKVLIAGFTSGLVGLLVASATNPWYSSIYFHAYVVMMLLLLSSTMQSDHAVRAAIEKK